MWLIIGIIVAAMTLGLVATLLATPQYSAVSRIEISRTQKNVTNVESLESAEAGRDQEFYQTQYSLLKARSLGERVVRQLRLGKSDALFEAHGVDSSEDGLFASKLNTQLSSAETLAREKAAVDLLMDNIEISPIRGSALVDISYTSASARLSAAISNSWTEQFIVQSMDRRFASTADARKFLEGRLADLRSRVETSEREVVNYASQRVLLRLAQLGAQMGKRRCREPSLLATSKR